MRKIGKFLIIVKAEWWVHGSSLYWLLYFCRCFKFSKRQSKKKKQQKRWWGRNKKRWDIFTSLVSDVRLNYGKIRHNSSIMYYGIWAWQSIILFCKLIFKVLKNNWSFKTLLAHKCCLSPPHVVSHLNWLCQINLSGLFYQEVKYPGFRNVLWFHLIDFLGKTVSHYENLKFIKVSCQRLIQILKF